LRLVTKKDIIKGEMMVTSVGNIFSPQSGTKSGEVNNLNQNSSVKEENRLEAIARAIAEGTYQIDVDSTAVAVAEAIKG
jgi:anti-sigma28 factor (negative regulator of flagellin synthesis)